MEKEVGSDCFLCLQDGTLKHARGVNSAEIGQPSHSYSLVHINYLILCY